MQSQRMRSFGVVGGVVALVAGIAVAGQGDRSRDIGMPVEGHDVAHAGTANHVGPTAQIESRTAPLGGSGGVMATGIAQVVYVAPGPAGPTVVRADRATGAVTKEAPPAGATELPEEFKASFPVMVYHRLGSVSRYFADLETDNVTVGGPIGDAAVLPDGTVWFEHLREQQLCFVRPLPLELHQCVAKVAVDDGTVVAFDGGISYIDTRANTITSMTESGTGMRSRLTAGSLASATFAAVNDGHRLDALVSDGTVNSLVTYRLEGAWLVEEHRRDLGRGRFSKPVSSASVVVVTEQTSGDVVRADRTRPAVDRFETALRKGAMPVREHDGEVWADAADGSETVLVPTEGHPSKIRIQGADLKKKPPVHRTPKRVERKVPVVPTSPPAPPGPPTDVTAIAGNDVATVTWRDAVPHGTPVTGYEIAWVGGNQPGGTQRAGPAANTATVGGLANGMSYVLSVRALSAAGPGPWASAPPVTPAADVPLAPGNVRAVAGIDATVTIDWDAADGAGRPVTGYDVFAESRAGRRAVARGVTGISVRLSENDGLAIGVEYRFSVSAVNDGGREGPRSAPSAPVVLGRPADAPRNAAVQPAGDGALQLTWEPPSANGGVITGYVVTIDNGVGRRNADTAPYTVSGLNNGTTYTITIAAETRIGTRPVTGSPATVQGVPGTVAVVTLQSASRTGDRQVTVTFTVDEKQSGTPTCHVYFDGAERWAAPCSGTVQATVGGLAYDTTYTVWVVATNGYGTGPQSGSTQVTTNSPPPSVAISKGIAVSASDCSTPSCREIDVVLSRFSPGATYRVSCWAAGESTSFHSYLVTTDGNGNHTSSVCYYGFPGREVWVVVNPGNVVSPRLTW